MFESGRKKYFLKMPPGKRPEKWSKVYPMAN